VNFLYGSANRLKSTGGVSAITASTLGFTANATALFGCTLAAGDFDNDGIDDLAIGADFDRVDGVNHAGSVFTVSGEKNLGVNVGTGQIWNENSTPNMPDFAQTDDRFGASVVCGDYNGDGYADVAIGVPGESFGSSRNGAVEILYGFFVGLTDLGNQFWTQSLLDSTDGNELGDNFGGILG
jgi:hypothetical protein